MSRDNCFLRAFDLLISVCPPDNEIYATKKKRQDRDHYCYLSPHGFKLPVRNLWCVDHTEPKLLPIVRQHLSLHFLSEKANRAGLLLTCPSSSLFGLREIFCFSSNDRELPLEDDFSPPRDSTRRFFGGGREMWTRKIWKALPAFLFTEIFRTFFRDPYGVPIVGFFRLRCGPDNPVCP